MHLKQKFSFSNFCPGRGLNPGPRSLMAVNITTRLRRHPSIDLCIHTWHIHSPLAHKCITIDLCILLCLKYAFTACLCIHHWLIHSLLAYAFILSLCIHLCDFVLSMHSLLAYAFIFDLCICVGCR